MVTFLFCENNNEGGYDMEVKAARAYDLAALKYWGPSTHINFPVYVMTSSSRTIQKLLISSLILLYSL